MAHYGQVLSVNRLRLDAHLGFYDGEREKLQPVEVCMRLYFPELPDFSADDRAEFIDYGMLCKSLRDFVSTRDFRLVEFMAMELFRHMRTTLDAQGYAAVKLWLRMNKIQAPVPSLLGGASFTHSDLPPGASIVAIDG